MFRGMYWDSYFTIKRVDDIIPVRHMDSGLSAQAGEYRPRDSDDDEGDKGKLMRLLECSRKSESMKIR